MQYEGSAYPMVLSLSVMRDWIALYRAWAPLASQRLPPAFTEWAKIGYRVPVADSNRVHNLPKRELLRVILNLPAADETLCDGAAERSSFGIAPPLVDGLLCSRYEFINKGMEFSQHGTCEICNRHRSM